MTNPPNTDQPLDLDAIEARHAADDARKGEDTGSFSVPMDSQGWATGPAVSYNPLPPIDGLQAHTDRAALLAEVRKLREALAPFSADDTSKARWILPDETRLEIRSIPKTYQDQPRTVGEAFTMADVNRARQALKGTQP